MKYSRHYSLFVGCLLLVACCRLVFSRHYESDYFRARQTSALKDAEQRQQTWDSLAYNTNRNNWLSALSATNVVKKLTLSSVQTNALFKCLDTVFQYVQEPDLEQYISLKTAGLRYVFSINTNAYFMNNEIAEDHSMVEAVSAGWAKLYQTNSLESLRGIHLESFATALTTTNDVTHLFNGEVGKAFIGLRQLSNPGFYYSPEDSPVSSEGLSIGPYFQLSFLAQLEPSRRSGPIFIRLGWSSHTESWAPLDFVADTSLGFNLLF